MAYYDDDDDDGLVWFGSDMELSLYLLCTWLQHSQTGSDKDEEYAATWESICYCVCFSFSFSFSSFPLHSQVVWASFLVLMFLEIS